MPSCTFIGSAGYATNISSATIAAYNQAAGRTIVAGIVTSQSGGLPTITSVTDTALNVYTFVGSFTPGNGRLVSFYHCVNCLGNAANQVRVTWSGTCSFSGMGAWDLGGIQTVSPLDVNTSGSTTSSTCPVGTFSTVAASEVLLYLCANISSFSTYSNPTLGGVAGILDGQSGQGGNEDSWSHIIVSAIQSGISASITMNAGTGRGGILSYMAAASTSSTGDNGPSGNEGAFIIRYTNQRGRKLGYADGL